MTSISRSRSAAIISGISLLTAAAIFADETWNGGGASNNWSDTGNWVGGNIPGGGEVTFSAGSANTNSNDDYTAFISGIDWNGSTAWTLTGFVGTVINVFDFGSGSPGKLQNLGSGAVTVGNNATIDFQGGANSFAEINAVSGDLTFASGSTIKVDSSAVNGFKLFGSGHNTTFNGTFAGSGKYIALTAANDTVNFGGAITLGNLYVMNGGTANLTGGTLSTSGLYLGGDFATTGNQDQTLGGTFNFAAAGGGQSFSNVIVSQAGNTSGALVINSQNTSGTNTISGGVFLDSNLAINQTVGGTLALSNSVDVKAHTLTLNSGTNAGTINATSAITDDGSGGGVVIGGTGAGTVNYSAANTYSGDTIVNSGTLAFSSGGNANNSIIRLGATSGSSPATLTITDAAGGNAVNSLLVVRPGSSGTKTISATNTSGTSTYGGNIFLDDDVTATSTNAGGTLAFTGGTFDLKNQTLSVNGAGTTNISGALQNSTGNGNLAKSDSGTLRLSGSSANTYGGATTINAGVVALRKSDGTNAISGSSLTVNNSGSAVTWEANNQVANSTTVTLAGGALNMNNGHQEGTTSTVGIGALTLSSNSVIDLSGSGNILHFADSSSQTWSGTLSIWNWNGTPIVGGGAEQLLFGGGNTALTQNQLNEVSFYSDGGTTFLGTAMFATINGVNGEIVPVPEASTWAAGILAAGALGLSRRRRFSRLLAVSR